MQRLDLLQSLSQDVESAGRRLEQRASTRITSNPQALYPPDTSFTMPPQPVHRINRLFLLLLLVGVSWALLLSYQHFLSSSSSSVWKPLQIASECHCEPKAPNNFPATCQSSQNSIQRDASRSICLAPRGAILFLMHPDRLSVLLDALRSLERNFFSVFGYRYPVYVFVEKQLDDIEEQLLRDATKANISSVYLPNFAVYPQNLSAEYDKEGREAAGQWPEGYYHMIRFWWESVFEHPLIAPLDFYWRLDTDSRIIAPLLYDPVQLLACTELAYAYRTISEDDTVYGMRQWMADYLNQTSLQPKQEIIYPHKETNSLQVYNNFEVVNLRKFLRSDVQTFFRSVTATNFIYTRRWGDGPLRYYMMKIFFDRLETLELCDIDYIHIGHVKKDCYSDKSRPLLYHLLTASNTIQREMGKSGVVREDEAKRAGGVLNVNYDDVMYLANAPD